MIEIRKLFSNDKKTIEDYITGKHKNFELNKAIYNKLYKTICSVILKSKEHGTINDRPQIKTPVLNIFNDAYWLCTLALLDDHPEENFKGKYIDGAFTTYKAKGEFELNIILSISYILFNSSVNIQLTN